MKSVFSLLNKDIQDLLLSKNIITPTPPQTDGIPHILEGKNVLLIAPTGLGKTEAALLPVFHNFLEYKKKNKEEKGIFILYITPLRALNRDMLRRTLEWGRELGIKIDVRHGDTSQSDRARQALKPPDMLITTPETFQILFIGKKLREYLKTVRWVVIDEIHELADDERGAQLSVGLERLEEITNKAGHSFQRIGLSATVGSPDEVARFLGGLDNGDFRDVDVIDVDVTKFIDIKVELPDVNDKDNVEASHLSIEPSSLASLRRCKELIESHNSTLLFTNTRDGAEILASRFNIWSKDLPVGIHHSSLSKLSRIEAEEDFKNGKLKALICTSSLELGIDVGNADFVIQYNSPREVKRILQRVGRSGHRIDRISKGIIITSTPEDLAESIVIARRALNREIEGLKIRKNPLSVLANQIVSLALEYGKIEIEEAYNIVKRAYPFYPLRKDLFIRVVEQLKNQRSIWVDQDKYILKRTSSRSYFLDNISMIPDEKSYNVVDIATRRKIGELDESFVISYAFEGAKFILKGIPWSVVKRENDEILVTVSKEIGAVPSWVGEDIPVPFEVAREVGMLRRIASSTDVLDNYPCDKNSYQNFVKQVLEQKKKGFVVPDDKTISIDVEDKIIVVNACFGTKVNETLGRLISAILAQSIGESVGVSSDAYRICLELPTRIPGDNVKEILMKINPDSLSYLLTVISKNSTFVATQLIHVAKKFGAIKKEFDIKDVGTKKIFTLFEGSLILEEAINKIIWERMDIENTKKVLEEIQRNEIAIHIQGLSPLSLAGLDKTRGLMVPSKADRTVLLALKKRLEEADVTLVCINCKHKWDTVVKRVDEKPKCSVCGAIKIAVLRRHNKDLIKLLNKKDLTKEEIKELKRIYKNSSLVLSYGKLAILTLAGRGIGPDTAARILSRYRMNEVKKSEDLEVRFLRDILNAELTYARTRCFWDED